MARTSFVDVALRLRGARRFQAEVAASTAQLEKMGVAGAASMGAFASKAERFRSAGRSLTTGLTLPIVAVGAVAGKMAIDFSDAINQIETQAGVGAAEVDRMRSAILDYAKSGASDATPIELADGMFRIASAGLRGAAAIDAMRKAEELATVGRVDMETASSALAAAVQTGIKGTENFDSAIGVLNATVGAGNMRMGDLVSAMGTGVVSAAKVSGLSFDQLGASIAFLTSKGQPAQASATRLAMTFAKLSAPTDKAAAAMERLGLQPLELAKMLQSGQFPAALRTLRERLDGLSKVEQGQVISDMFGGGRSSRAILTILDDLDGFESKLGQIRKKSGSFGDALASTMNEPGVKWNVALTQMSAVMIEFGDNVGPIAMDLLKNVVGVITNIATAFSKLPKPVRSAAAGLIAFAVVIGPIIWGVGIFAKGIGALVIVLPKLILLTKGFIYVFRALSMAMLMNPIGLIVVAIVALGVALVVAYKKVGWFRDAVNAVISFVKNNWKTILPMLAGPVVAAVALIVRNWDSIVGFVKKLPGRIAAAASGMFDGIKNAFREAINFIIRAWNGLDLSLTIPIANKTVSIGTPNIPELATGGTVTRPGAALVGERGPELLSLPRAASVIPLSDRVMNAVGGTQRIEVPVYLDGRQIALAVAGEVSTARARA